MATNLTGLKVKDTYNSLLKIGDNSSLSATPDKISDGLGNESVLYLSTSQVSIGALPASGYDLTVGNSGIKTGRIDVTNAATAASLQLTGGTGSQGTLSWNTEEETVDIIQNGAVLQVGQEIHVHVRNNTGSTINDGTPVYVTGTLGASGRLTVAPMIADGSIPAKFFLGVTTEDIPNGEDGKVTTFGKIRGVNTSAYSEGQTLFVSSTTAGFWQTTPPASPALDLEAAIVISSKNNGTLFVRAQQGYYLGMLHDVYLNNVANDQILAYNSTEGRWENSSIGSIGSINLDTVTDNGNTTTNDINVGAITASNLTLTGYLRGAANFVIDPAAYGDETGVVQILGDLRVDGTTTTINSTTVTIADKNIVLAEGSATAADANGAGITIDGADATMTYNSTSDRFVFNKNIETNLVGDVIGSADQVDGLDATDFNLQYVTTNGASTTNRIVLNTGQNGGFRMGDAILRSVGTNASQKDFIVNAKAMRIGAHDAAWNYDEWAGIAYVHSSKTLYIGGARADGTIWANNAGDTNDSYVNFIGLVNNGLQVNGNTVWHEGNDGAGSGLNADQVDGLDATDFTLDYVTDNNSVTLNDITVGANAVNGGRFIAPNYNGSNRLGVLSSMYSSGNLLLAYGLEGNSGASGYASTYANFSGRHGGIEIYSKGFKYVGDTANSQTAIGDLITVTEFFNLDEGDLTISGSFNIDTNIVIDSSRQAFFTNATVGGTVDSNNFNTTGGSYNVDGNAVITSTGKFITDEIEGDSLSINATTQIDLKYNGSSQLRVDQFGVQYLGTVTFANDGISLTDEDSTTDSFFHANVNYDAGLYQVNSNARYGSDYIQVDGLDTRQSTVFAISPKETTTTSPKLYLGGNNSITAPNTLVDWATIYLNATSVRINNAEVATQSWVTNNIDLQTVTDAGHITTNAISVAHGSYVTSSNSSLTRLYIENTGNATAGSGLYLSVKDGSTTVGNTTIRIDNNGIFKIFNGTTSDQLNFQLDTSGNATITGNLISSRASFLDSTTSRDSVQFYNTDNKYSYIRQTSNANGNNLWIDTPLGADLWLNWDNPGQERTAGTYSDVWFGTGRGTSAESVRIYQANIEGRNSAGTVTYRINPDGDTYFNGGEVGIGTTPSYTLDVSSPNNESARFSSPTGGVIIKGTNTGGFPGFVLQDGSTNKWNIRHHNASEYFYFYDYTANRTVLQFNNNGDTIFRPANDFVIEDSILVNQTNPTTHLNYNWYSVDDNSYTVNVFDINSLYFKRLTTGQGYDEWVLYPETVGLNFDISFKLTLTQNSSYRHFGIAIASDGSNNTSNFDYLILRDFIGDANLRQVRIDIAGISESSLVSSSLPSFADGTERHILIQVRGRRYVIEVDGVVVHNFLASARTSNRGKVGFCIYEGNEPDNYAYIRQFKIKQYSDNRTILGGVVGINTQNPQEELDVAGAILATDLRIESGASASIRIGDGFGSGGAATIHNYQQPLYLQFNNGTASGVNAEVRVGGGGSVSDLNMFGGGSIKVSDITIVDGSRQAFFTNATVGGTVDSNNFNTTGGSYNVDGTAVITSTGKFITDEIEGGTLNINGTTQINLKYNGSTKAYIDATGFNVSGGLNLGGVDGISLTDEDSTIDSFFHANVNYDAGLYQVTSDARYGADYIQVDGLDTRTNTVFVISPKETTTTNPDLYLGGDFSTTAPNTLVNWRNIEMNATSVQINNNEVIHAGNYTSYTDSKYLRSDANDSTSGTLDVNGGLVRIVGDASNIAQLVLSEGNPDNHVILEYDGTGSGATNYFHIYSSIDTWMQKGDSLNIQPSTGRVSIGNTSFDEVFHVTGNIKTDSLKLPFTGGILGTIGQYFGSLQIRTNAGGAIELGGDGTGTVQNDVFVKNGKFIVENGSVGIGTTTPSHKLTVRTSGDVYSADFYQSDSGTDKYNAIRVRGAMTSAVGYYGIGGSTTGNTSFRDAFVVGTQSAHSLNLATNDTARMTINSAGNVGIGTTSPSHKLTVSGDTYLNGKVGIGITPTTTWDLRIRGQYPLQLSSSSSVAKFEFYADLNENRYLNGAKIVGYNQDLSIDTNSSSYDILLANNGGNVGIGTTSPSHKLHVNGNIRIAGVGESLLFDTTGADASNGIRTINDYETVIYNNRGVAGFAVIGNSSIRLGFGTSYTAAQSIIYIPSSGNVGIGTTSPAEKLDVAGKIRTTGRNYSYGQFNHHIELVEDTGSGYLGNVNQSIYLSNGSYFGAQIYNVSATQTGLSTIYLESTGNILFLNQTFTAGVSTVTATEKMRINANGNVGIGTTSPQAKLEVQGSAPYIFITDDTETESGIVFRDLQAGYSQAAAIKFSSSDNKLRFNVNDTDAVRMTIGTDGFVGIGNDNPGYNLDVTGDARITSRVGINTTPGGSGDEQAKLRIIGSAYGDKCFYFQGSGLSSVGFIEMPSNCAGVTFENNGASGQSAFSFKYGSTFVGSVAINSTTTSYNTTSDYRLKENLTDITDGIERLKQLKPKRFNFIGHEQVVDGFVAHEAQAVVPESVTGEKDGVDYNGEPEYQGIDQAKLVPLLTAALQEAVAKIEALEQRILTLENK